VISETIVEHQCPDVAAARIACGDLIASVLHEALARDPRVGLVLSGGRNPAEILPRLAATDLDWARVEILPGDERLVPDSDPDSNAGLALRAFAGAARAPRIFSLGAHPPAPAEAASALAAAWAAFPPPAIAFLGIGTDGHVASLFPGTDAATDDASVALATEAPPAPHRHARVSLGMSALLACPRICLVVDGPEKTTAYRRALIEPDRRALPIAGLLRSAARIDIFLA
jgi:6-phosphogluconolactonase